MQGYSELKDTADAGPLLLEVGMETQPWEHPVASDLCGCVLACEMEKHLGETEAEGRCWVSFPHLCTQPRSATCCFSSVITAWMQDGPALLRFRVGK